MLAVPMLREGTPIGTISIWRENVMPFSERQIELVTTFADQAVIAIENVRLFNELDTRNRQLTEALEQQTATSEILRVIASSPTDLQPMLDAVAESAARLCDSNDSFIWRIDNEVLQMAANTAELLSPEGDGHQSTGPLHLAELWSMERLFTSKTLRHPKVSFRGPKITEYAPESARRWLHRCYVKVSRSEQFIYVGGKSDLLQTSRLNCLRPSRTKR